MQNMTLPSTRDNFIKETLKRSQTVTKEFSDKCSFVTYDLALAKNARKVHIRNSPKFDDYLIQFGRIHITLSVSSSTGKILNKNGAEYLLTKANIIFGASIYKFLIRNAWLSYHCNAWLATRNSY